jgi:hypothetical protein
MSEKVFNHVLLNFLNQMIVKDGEVHIDSVFRFEQNPEGLPAFLQMAKKHNCTVIFENEGYTFKPKSENNVSDTAMISGLMIYMNMGKTLFGKRINYLMNLITNENWVKGQHEPILKENVE